MFLSLLLVTVAQDGSDIYDFDVNGRRVSYYPESLMLSHNPQAIVFYHDTKLLNLFIDLRVPDIGRDFAINNTCDDDQSYFLSVLLGQMRNIQKSIQRIQSSHGYTSLIECESYIKRYYQYATGLTATMTCPYSYRRSLRECKHWALKTCKRISPTERRWLRGSERSPRSKRGLPWACTAGVFGIPRFFYTTFGGSCDTGNNIAGITHMFTKVLGAETDTQRMIRTVNGKTVYLARITDKLITKVNHLQSSLRQLDSTFADWKPKLEAFAKHENCHYNNFMEFLAKFSLEVARTFSSQLRSNEIYDVLHQAHRLHGKQLAGFSDLPSFLATSIQSQLTLIPSLHTTVGALESGYPLLMQPFVDYQFDLTKSMGVNVLFTLPELVSDHAFCTIEYLLPLKYNISGTCFQGPITRDELALLRCPHTDYILHRTLLNKCYHANAAFVCPQNILQRVNDTRWLGLPWNAHSKVNFVRRHQQASDCSNLHDLIHLGGRYYLSTQHTLLPVFNSTNDSSHLMSLTPLTIYHFPCELTFSTQQTGLGTCPDRITFHLPLFTTNSLRYIPWTHANDNLLALHYKSLNFTPPLHFDNATLNSLEHTFRLLDGQLTNKLASIKHDISHLHTVTTSTLNDRLTYLALALTSLNTIIIGLLYCRIQRPPTRPFFRRKNPPKRTPDESDHACELEPALPLTSLSEAVSAVPSCSACSKPVSASSGTKKP